MAAGAGAITAVRHGLDVGARLEGLVEVAYVAGDVFVTGDGEGNDGLWKLVGQSSYTNT